MKKFEVSEAFFLIFAISLLFSAFLLKGVPAEIEDDVGGENKNAKESYTPSFVTQNSDTDETVYSEESADLQAYHISTAEKKDDSDPKSISKDENNGHVLRQLGDNFGQVAASQAATTAVNTVVRSVFSDMYKEGLKPFVIFLFKKIKNFFSNISTHRKSLNIFSEWYDNLYKHLHGENVTANKAFNKKLKEEFIECCKVSWDESPIHQYENQENILRVALTNFKPCITNKYDTYDKSVVAKYDMMLQEETFLDWVAINPKDS